MFAPLDFPISLVCSVGLRREILDPCGASWQLRRGTALAEGLLERGGTLWDSVPQPGALGTALSVWKTCLFPTPDLEMLFSCANVQSCEAAVPFCYGAAPELPRACRRFLSLPRNTLFKVLKKLSHPEQREAFSEENTGLDPGSACCSVAKSLAGDRR